MEAFWHLTGTHPYHKIPPGNGWAISPDFTLSETITKKKVFELFPPDRIKHYDREFRILSIYADGGQVTELTFKSADSDPRKFAGARLAFEWFDEPVRQAIWNECLGRRMRDRPLYIWLTMTPLPGLEDWITMDLEEPWENGDRTDVNFVYASIDDNPYVTDAQKAKQKLIYKDTEDYEGRIEGKSVSRLGRVYKFHRQLHVCKRMPIQPDWTIVNGLDPHQRVAFHFLWLAVAKDRKYIVGELRTMPDQGLPAIVEEVKRYEARYGLRPHYRVVDTIANTPEVASRTTISRELRRLGLSYRDADKSVELGHLLIQQSLAEQTRFDPILGRQEAYADLQVFDDCTQLIWEFEHAKWEEHKHREEKEVNEKIRKKKIHLLDVLRYILNSKPRYGMIRPVTSSIVQKLMSGVRR